MSGGGAVLVVADTLRNHMPVFDENGHINGTVPGRGAWDCFCGMVVNVAEDDVLAHVAAAVVDALGGLTRETRFEYTHLGTGKSMILESTDVQVARKIAGTTHELTEVSRWVSGWVREPAEEGQ